MGGGVTSKLETKLKKVKTIKTSKKIDALLSSYDDKSLGLEFIKEKKLRLLIDIRLSGDFLEKMALKLESQLDLPVPSQKIKTTFSDFISDHLEEFRTDLDRNYLNTNTHEELVHLLKSELLYPLLSKNKRNFMYIISEKIKEFVSKVELSKQLDLKKAKNYIESQFSKYKFTELLKRLLGIINDENNPGSMYKDPGSNFDDHIIKGYSIFKNNLTNYLKLVIYFFEKAALEYDILTPSEFKMNYKITLGNVYFLLVGNLERKNYAIFKYWKSELNRYVSSLNLVLSKNKLKQKMIEYQDDLGGMVRELKNIHKKVQGPILGFNGDPKELLLFKPVREKYQRLMDKLLTETIPRFYDSWGSIDSEILEILRDEINLLYSNKALLFSKSRVMKLAKSEARRDPEFYDKLVLDLFFICTYNLSKKFGRKYNFIEKREFISS